MDRDTLLLVLSVVADLRRQAVSDADVEQWDYVLSNARREAIAAGIGEREIRRATVTVV